MSVKHLLVFLSFIALVFGLNQKQLVEYAVKQYTRLNKTLETGIRYPSDGTPTDSTWHTTDSNNQWTAGFYPGTLWNIYNLTKNEEWKKLAIKATDGMLRDQNRTDTHDIGFMIMCSYGNGFELTKNVSYPQVIINAAHSLAKRFNPHVGCTRSWNNRANSSFLVIVDNMMNLELLFTGHLLSGNKTLYDIAVSHANRTIEAHIRKDYSSFHIVDFNNKTGQIIRRYTGQGYSDSSCWARGQAWLINGFTTTYRFTKAKHFLETAEKLANYYISHLPEDGIAPWDFDVPKDKYSYIPRDTSSAAIAAAGLFELYGFTKNETHLKTAHKIMESLSSDKYRADGKAVYKLPSLVVNATIAGPNAAKGKSDVALTYADYYFTKCFKYFN